jgi:hypothetical protein
MALTRTIYGYRDLAAPQQRQDQYGNASQYFQPGQPVRADLLNQIAIGGLGSLGEKQKQELVQAADPGKLQEFLGMTGGGGGGTGGSGGGGGMSADDLLKAYQDGVGIGGSSGLSFDQQMAQAREAHNLDLERQTKTQEMELAGQKTMMDQARQARAAEKEQDFRIKQREQNWNRSQAVSAYKGL